METRAKKQERAMRKMNLEASLARIRTAMKMAGRAIDDIDKEDCNISAKEAKNSFWRVCDSSDSCRDCHHWVTAEKGHWKVAF